MRTTTLVAAALLAGSALAALAPSASAHPVQLDCSQRLGYTAIGPTLGNPNSWWIATIGTGGACADYPFVCFYDPLLEDPCGDARHPIPVPLCRSCIT